jgi:hypothetical protein
MPSQRQNAARRWLYRQKFKARIAHEIMGEEE